MEHLKLTAVKSFITLATDEPVKPSSNFELAIEIRLKGRPAAFICIKIDVYGLQGRIRLHLVYLKALRACAMKHLNAVVYYAP